MQNKNNPSAGKDVITGEILTLELEVRLAGKIEKKLCILTDDNRFELAGRTEGLDKLLGKEVKITGNVVKGPGILWTNVEIFNVESFERVPKKNTLDTLSESFGLQRDNRGITPSK